MPERDEKLFGMVVVIIAAAVLIAAFFYFFMGGSQLVADWARQAESYRP